MKPDDIKNNRRTYYSIHKNIENGITASIWITQKYELIKIITVREKYNK